MVAWMELVATVRRRSRNSEGLPIDSTSAMGLQKEGPLGLTIGLVLCGFHGVGIAFSRGQWPILHDDLRGL